MAQYWEDDTPLPPIDWDTLIRVALVLVTCGLTFVTACCLGRLWLWAVEAWR